MVGIGTPRIGWLVGLAVAGLTGCGPSAQVVVVGGGLAGMSAAMEASGCARVTLLEGRDRLGGSASLGDAVTAVPSAGALATLDAAAGHSNAARARFVAEVKPQVMDFFAERGVSWRALPAEPDGTEVFEPVGGGRHLVSVLEAELKSRGVQVRFGARVEGLGREGDRVTVRGGDGLGDVAPAEAVVLATGGWAGNLERTRERLGLGDVPLLRGAASFADGNGIALATSLGGVEVLPGQAVLYAHGVPAADDPTRALMLVDGAHVFPVDAAGAYLPEAQTPRGDAGDALRARPGATAWAILDKKAIDNIPLWDADAAAAVPIRPLLSRIGVTAPSMEALAAKLGLPVAALAAGLAPGPRDQSPEHPLLASSSWAAVPIRLTTAKSLTGVRIDLDGRALDATGAPLPGLYAAGELAGFAHPWEGRHVDSTMASGAVLTGRAAGRAVCTDLASRARR